VPQPRPTTPARRALWAAAGIACALTLPGCDAGNEAETVQETPDVAGTDGTAGLVSLDDVFLDAEGDVAAGASVPLRAVFTNGADEADRLVRVTTPAAGSVQLLDEAGQAGAEGIELPAGGQVEAVTGAARIQLEGVSAPIAPTDTVRVTFAFDRAGEVTLDVPVAPGPGPVD
jgi:periplasmic copper chaperone A